MKKLFLIGLLSWSCGICAQTGEEATVKDAIQTFFEFFHAQDTAGMKDMALADMKLQTTGRNKEGKTMVRTVEFEKFLNSIASIPDSINFEEKIKGFEIKTDGPLASAWTPYEFWINGKMSHCGVNSFQFVKVAGQWKIAYLIDTRRRENCDPAR